MKTSTMLTLGAVAIVALIVIEQMSAGANNAQIAAALAAKGIAATPANVTAAQNYVAQNISAAGGLADAVLNSDGFSQFLTSLMK